MLENILILITELSSKFKMSANIRDGDVESSQEEMICSKCSEKIIGKAMKVVSLQNNLLQISSYDCFVQAGARHWHEACFVCADCGIKLIGAKVVNCHDSKKEDG